ncbi:Unknown protein, partial [Striga hermonthica]
ISSPFAKTLRPDLGVPHCMSMGRIQERPGRPQKTLPDPSTVQVAGQPSHYDEVLPAQVHHQRYILINSSNNPRLNGARVSVVRCSGQLVRVRHGQRACTRVASTVADCWGDAVECWQDACRGRAGSGYADGLWQPRACACTRCASPMQMRTSAGRLGTRGVLSTFPGRPRDGARVLLARWGCANGDWRDVRVNDNEQVRLGPHRRCSRTLLGVGVWPGWCATACNDSR